MLSFTSSSISQAQPHPSTYEFGHSGTLDQVSNPTPIKKNAIFTFNLLLVLDRKDLTVEPIHINASSLKSNSSCPYS
jgi:hypothetical protein